ncbi:MAG: hypothetical protein Q4D39_04340 [Coriobacteriaceae bacterium]|nr:hypothetical protein [Coriobacteriaceae bacterium]
MDTLAGDDRTGRDMVKRRSTPRDDLKRPAITDARILVIAAAAVIALVIIALLLSRCSGDGAGVSSESRDVAVVVEPESEEARERREYAEAWGERIDAFNAGYPLEGYGTTFAYAAYDYGVDPRIAPAIARIESGSGEHCFLPCNAWGWGDVSWPDWETAIWEFTRGFSEDYGGEVTYEVAERYNQVNVDEWYALVTSCMDQI